MDPHDEERDEDVYENEKQEHEAQGPGNPSRSGQNDAGVSDIEDHEPHQHQDSAASRLPGRSFPLEAGVVGLGLSFGGEEGGHFGQSGVSPPGNSEDAGMRSGDGELRSAASSPRVSNQPLSQERESTGSDPEGHAGHEPDAEVLGQLIPDIDEPEAFNPEEYEENPGEFDDGYYEEQAEELGSGIAELKLEDSPDGEERRESGLGNGVGDELPEPADDDLQTSRPEECDPVSFYDNQQEIATNAGLYDEDENDEVGEENEDNGSDEDEGNTELTPSCFPANQEDFHEHDSSQETGDSPQAQNARTSSKEGTPQATSSRENLSSETQFSGNPNSGGGAGFDDDNPAQQNEQTESTPQSHDLTAEHSSPQFTSSNQDQPVNPAFSPAVNQTIQQNDEASSGTTLQEPSPDGTPSISRHTHFRGGVGGEDSEMGPLARSPRDGTSTGGSTAPDRITSPTREAEAGPSTSGNRAVSPGGDGFLPQAGSQSQNTPTTQPEVDNPQQESSSAAPDPQNVGANPTVQPSIPQNTGGGQTPRPRFRRFISFCYRNVGTICLLTLFATLFIYFFVAIGTGALGSGKKRKSKPAKRDLSTGGKVALGLAFIPLLGFLVVTGCYRKQEILTWAMGIRRYQGLLSQRPGGTSHGGHGVMRGSGREQDIERGDGTRINVAPNDIPLDNRLSQAEGNHRGPVNQQNKRNANVQGVVESEGIEMMPRGRFRSKREGVTFRPSLSSNGRELEVEETVACTPQNHDDVTEGSAGQRNGPHQAFSSGIPNTRNLGTASGARPSPASRSQLFRDWCRRNERLSGFYLFLGALFVPFGVLAILGATGHLGSKRKAQSAKRSLSSEDKTQLAVGILLALLFLVAVGRRIYKDCGVSRQGGDSRHQAPHTQPPLQPSSGISSHGRGDGVVGGESLQQDLESGMGTGINTAPDDIPPMDLPTRVEGNNHDNSARGTILSGPTLTAPQNSLTVNNSLSQRAATQLQTQTSQDQSQPAQDEDQPSLGPTKFEKCKRCGVEAFYVTVFIIGVFFFILLVLSLSGVRFKGSETSYSAGVLAGLSIVCLAVLAILFLYGWWLFKRYFTPKRGRIRQRQPPAPRIERSSSEAGGQVRRGRSTQRDQERGQRIGITPNHAHRNEGIETTSTNFPVDDATGTESNNRDYSARESILSSPAIPVPPNSIAGNNFGGRGPTLPLPSFNSMDFARPPSTSTSSAPHTTPKPPSNRATPRNKNGRHNHSISNNNSSSPSTSGRRNMSHGRAETNNIDGSFSGSSSSRSIVSD